MCNFCPVMSNCFVTWFGLCEKVENYQVENLLVVVLVVSRDNGNKKTCNFTWSGIHINYMFS